MFSYSLVSKKAFSNQTIEEYFLIKRFAFPSEGVLDRIYAVLQNRADHQGLVW